MNEQRSRHHSSSINQNSNKKKNVFHSPACLSISILSSFLITTTTIVFLFHIFVSTKTEAAVTIQKDDNDIPWGVSWNAPFLSPSGYGLEAISMILGLRPYVTNNNEDDSSDSRKWNVMIGQHGDATDYSYASTLPKDLINWISEGLNRQRALLLISNREASKKQRKKTIIICHSEPGAWTLNSQYQAMYQTTPCPPSSSYNNNNDEYAAIIGRTMFETDKLPSGWEKRLNFMDEVWVPTLHHKKIFEKGGVVVPIEVVGQGIDTSFWNASLESVEPLGWDEMLHYAADATGTSCREEDYKFLSVFKWEQRKGHDVLLKAFWKAFPPSSSATNATLNNNGVCLVIVTSLYHRTFEEIQKDLLSYLNEINDDEQKKNPSSLSNTNVILLSGLPTDALRRLYKSVDAFVLPTRGEGWGRPYMEAMSMSLPVIATNWSGPTAFVTEENGYLLGIEEDLADAGLNAFPGHKWAEPLEEDLVNIMVHLKSHPEEGRQKGVQGRKDVLELWSHEVIGKELMRHFNRIASSPLLQEMQERPSDKDDASSDDNKIHQSEL